MRQAFFISTGLALLVVFLEEWAFLKPQSYQILIGLGEAEINKWAVLLTTIISFCTLVLFFFLLFSLARKFRIYMTIVYALPLLVQLICWEVFHRSLSISDINIAITSFSSIHSATQVYFNPLVVIPVVMMILAVMALPGDPNFRRALQLGLIMLALVSINTLAASLELHTNWGTAVPKFYETVGRYIFSDIQQIKREVIAPVNPSQPDNNIVLIIDESIRSDHLSLNGYSRSTTPYLEQIAQENPSYIHNWGTIASGATCSPLSNALLITGVQVSPANSADEWQLVQQYPTLFQYAKAMGYRTTYYDGQTNYLWNGLTVIDLAAIDNWIKTVPDESDHTVDIRAADWIYNTVSRSTGNFIVLNKKGAHYLYENSYPKSATIWSPAPTDYLSQPDLVMNVYDNAVHFSVNTFFEHLLSPPNPNSYKTVYLWTSDHSQTLFEDGATWSHCNYYPVEAAVPLVVFGDLPISPDLQYQASHANIFPTLLDLMGVPAELRIFSYSPSLLQKQTVPTQSHRYFVSGDGSVIDFDQ